jgi:hypothetical protein
MPVRNALPFLDVAIRSILDQSYTDFEFLIGDDGSTDGSREQLIAWARQDERIRLVLGAAGGQGPAGSSNWITRLARSPIVARMDADDLSGPNRLRAQLAALDANPDAVLVGSLFDCIDAEGAIVRRASLRHLRDVHPGRQPFSHGSIMFRSEAFERAGGYRSSCDYWEDMDLYWRMADIGQLLVLPEAHYSYRFNPGHSRLTAQGRRVELALDLAFRCTGAKCRGEDYEPLLTEPLAANRRISPAVFRAMGNLRLQAGGRPFILFEMLRHSALAWNRETLTATAWAIWAAVSPGTLRTAGRVIADYLGRPRGEVENRPYRWCPASASIDSRLGRLDASVENQGDEISHCRDMEALLLPG